MHILYIFFWNIFYGNVYSKYLRVNMVCKIFQTCVTLELSYHGKYLETQVLCNMFWENSDFILFLKIMSFVNTLYLIFNLTCLFFLFQGLVILDTLTFTDSLLGHCS